jgi:hypothetical protein
MQISKQTHSIKGYREESKECKETDKQILEEGRCCRVRKSKECKETDRQIPEEACCYRGKER